MTLIRKLRSGDYLVHGQMTLGRDGLPLIQQGGDSVIQYTFDWSDYYTASDGDAVTVIVDASNCTALKVDGENKAVITVSNVSSSRSSIKVTIAVTDGQTFTMSLRFDTQDCEVSYGSTT